MKYQTVKQAMSLLLCLCMLLGALPGTVAYAEDEVTMVSAVTQMAEELDRAIDLLPQNGSNRNGRVRLAGFTQSANGSTDMKDLRGRHYLIRVQDNIFYALDGSWTGTDDNLPLKVVTASDTTSFLYISANISPSMAFDFHYTGLASNGMPGYVLRFSNGKNLGIGSQYTGTYTNLYKVKADTTSDLSKAPKIRFEHPNGSGWARIRNLEGTHGLRQDSAMTCVRWKDNSAGDNAYDGNALYLYRLWSTSGLLSVIHSMKSYLLVPELYEEAGYTRFLNSLHESIELFHKYNANPTALIDPYDFIQEALDQKATELQACAKELTPVQSPSLEQTAILLRRELETLPASGTNRNGRVRLAGFKQSADGSTDMKELRGKHYLIRVQDSIFYALDGSWTGTDDNLPLKVVTGSDTTSFLYISANISPSMAFDFHYTGTASNGMPGYVLRFNNGKNLGIGSQYTGTYTNLYKVKADTTSDLSKAPKIRFEHPDGSGWARIRNLAGTHGLRQDSAMTCVRWKDNSAGDNAYDGNALYLYRLWSTSGLISAIHSMKSYLDTPEFYDETVYSAFLTCMRESIDLFHKYNVNPTALIDPYDFIQETLDQKAAELRNFASVLNVQMQDPSQEELSAATTIHQLPSKLPRDEGDYSHNMSYIIQTRQGKIIIIDGGWEKDNLDGTFLFGYLQKITGDSTPHINAWFITHAHGDHHGAVATFANRYANQVTVDAFYHHYPTDAQIETYLSECGIDGTKSATARVPSMMKKLKNSEGGPVKEYFVNSKHSGKCNNSFDFDEVHIDILLDFEDIIWAVNNVSGTYSGTPEKEGRTFTNLTFKQLVTGNMNETSTVFRVTVGGKSILFTGDINYVGGYMLNKYHDANAKNSDTYFSLKSDYVQVSHHGYYGLPKTTYQKIDPDVALWPTPKYEYTATTSTNKNLVCTRQWFTDMGVTSYASYLGPQVFTFPLVRSDAAVSIPAELKDFVFDAEYYSNQYADLAQLYGTDEKALYYHFVNYGIEEGRSASPFFDVKFYANNNGQTLLDTVKGDYLAAFRDFLNQYRTTSLRKLSEQFDASVYAAGHPELTAQGYVTTFSLLKHYAQNGYAAGEIASTTFLCDDLTNTYHSNCTVTPAVEATCTTEGKTVGIRCNTCGLVLQAQETIAPTGHNYTYQDMGAEHVASCDCGWSESQSHSFTDGICICGAQEGPVLVENITILHTLNLASDISVTYAVQRGLLADYDSYYLECVVPSYKENELVGSTTYTVEPTISGSYYYFTLQGMNALCMNDVVASTLYMQKGDRWYCSAVDYYSIAQYAYGQLNNSTAKATLKSLCADLLRYGSYAQQYKGYRTDHLADEAMTDAHRAYLSDMDSVTFSNNQSYLNDCETPSVSWVGKTLDLGNKVSIIYVADLSNYLDNLDSISLRIRFTNLDGKEQTHIIRDLKPYGSSTYRYTFTFDGLLAAELRNVVCAAVYAGEEQVSQTLVYSADTYGNGVSGLLRDLCKALFAYSDSAKTYFG